MLPLMIIGFLFFCVLIIIVSVMMWQYTMERPIGLFALYMFGLVAFLLGREIIEIILK